MSKIEVTQDDLDMAREWVGVNYPDLDGSEYDTKVAEVAEEFAMDRCREDAHMAKVHIQRSVLASLDWRVELDNRF